MADVTTMSAGTGPIAQSGNTPGDILMEQLLNSVVAPTVNNLLDVSATTSHNQSGAATGTKNQTETQTGTKTTGTTGAAQALINQQISDIQASLTGGNSQYADLIGNILTSAAQTFNPTNTQSRRSGAYSSTTLDQLRNDAVAKATAASADAVLSDKRAKLASLVSLIEQNAAINKTEAVNSSGTIDENTTGTSSASGKTNVESNRIGSGAATAAKVGGAALLASSLLKGDVGKTLTDAGKFAFKKIIDMAGSSGNAAGASVTGLPDNWFDDWSSGTVSTDDITAALGAQEADQAAMEQAVSDVFGSSSAVSNWLNSGNAYAGYGAAVANALDGEWGGNDTGSTVGATLGSYFGPIGSWAGSLVGGVVGESAIDGTGDMVANSGLGLLTGDTSLGDIISTGGGSTDILQTDFNAVNDAVNWISDGCFITTACMKALAADFDDNCLELTLLRQVRDEYIANLPDGAEVLAAYREYAPQYVQLIEAQPDSEKIWQELYTDFILPAVRYAQDGLFKKAYLTYLFMLQHVQGVTGLRSE